MQGDLKPHVEVYHAKVPKIRQEEIVKFIMDADGKVPVA